MDYEILHGLPSAATEAAWHACLAEADYATHYVSPAFFREPFWDREQPFAVLARSGDTVAGVATGIREGRQLICGVVGRPQACCRRSADREQVSRVLAAGLASEAKGLELVTLFAWTRLEGAAVERFREREYDDEYGVVLLDLSRGKEQLFKDFSQTRRNDVRKAMNQGVQVVPLSSQDEFEQYYAIYVDWCEMKGIPATPPETMERALSLKENRLVLLARHDGRVIAGSVFRFYPGGMVEYSANSSRRRDSVLKPNDLLCWRSIEWSCDNGFTSYSMGGANVFRRKFGGTVHTCYRYRLDRTLTRRHDRKEALLRRGLRTVLGLPAPIRDRILRAFGRQS